MSNAGREAAVANLRAITYRLSSTPTNQLPQVAPQIASQLWSCKDLLSTTPDSNKQNNDASVVVHRFKTHVSTLLQDRTIEGRWSAVVLVKAAIEAGGLEVLSKSNAWVRNLLAVLKKPGPSSTRSLATIALTRIFVLTWDHTNLVREITTPALPTFVANCLSNAASQRCSSTELQTILEAFVTLVPRHPTIFRTNETQIRSLLGKIISGTTSGTKSRHYNELQRKASQRLLVLLHHCSPKQGAAGKWDETVQIAVKAAHATCDRILRSVVEDWQSTSQVQASVSQNVLLQGEVESEGDQSLALNGWKGIFAGSERLIVLLDLIGSHILNMTSVTVALRLGLIADLLTRLLSVRAPSGKHQGLQANNQISKEERDALFTVLPRVHVSALHLFRTLQRRFDLAAMPILQPIMTQVAWVFESEVLSTALRPAVYVTLALALKIQGPYMSKEDIAAVEAIVRVCCQDLLPNDDSAQVSGIVSKSSGAANGVIGQNNGSQPSHPTHLAELKVSAQALLPICLSNLNPSHVPSRLRTLMERTAIMTQHEDALLAAVLYPAQNKKPPNAQASLLPILARQFATTPEIEALLRPRMPVIKTGSSTIHDEDPEESSEDEVPDAAMNGIDENDKDSNNLMDTFDGSEQSRADSGKASAAQAWSSFAQVENGAIQTSDVTRVAEKRVAESANDDRSAKRSRASPLPEIQPSQPAASLPDTLRDVVQGDVPATLAYEQPQSSFVTALEPSQQVATIPAAPTNTIAKDEDDDDSDFEMPPLTMEQDTDPEDEDEDEE